MIYPENGSDTLSIKEAFLAMEHFLKAFHKRGGSPADGPMIDLLSFIDMSAQVNQPGPADPAMWSDWIDAIQAVRSQYGIV